MLSRTGEGAAVYCGQVHKKHLVTGSQSIPGFVPCKVHSIEKVGDNACHQGGGCRRFTTSEPGVLKPCRGLIETGSKAQNACVCLCSLVSTVTKIGIFQLRPTFGRKKAGICADFCFLTPYVQKRCFLCARWTLSTVRWRPDNHIIFNS